MIFSDTLCFPQSLGMNRKGIEETAISKEELVFIEMKKNGVKFPHIVSENSPSNKLGECDVINCCVCFIY